MSGLVECTSTLENFAFISTIFVWALMVEARRVKNVSFYTMNIMF